MKKTLLASIVVASTLALTGCSSVSFDNITLDKAPEWDISKATNGAWGNQDFESNERDISSANYMKFYDKDKNCYVDGRIAYFTPTAEDNKDKENSLEYLDSLGLQNVNGKDFVTSETVVNGTKYVAGEYQLPPSFGEYSYHKTAVRVFSTLISIPEVNQENATGMPLVILDLACKNAKDINQNNWNKASGFFNLMTSDEAVVVDNKYETSTTPPVANNSDLPPSEGLENIPVEDVPVP